MTKNEPRNQLLKIDHGLLKREERRKRLCPRKPCLLCPQASVHRDTGSAHVAVRRQGRPLLESCRQREMELVQWKRAGGDGGAFAASHSAASIEV